MQSCWLIQIQFFLQFISFLFETWEWWRKLLKLIYTVKSGEICFLSPFVLRFWLLPYYYLLTILLHFIGKGPKSFLEYYEPNIRKKEWFNEGTFNHYRLKLHEIHHRKEWQLSWIWRDELCLESDKISCRRTSGAKVGKSKASLQYRVDCFSAFCLSPRDIELEVGLEDIRQWVHWKARLASLQWVLSAGHRCLINSLSDLFIQQMASHST